MNSEGYKAFSSTSPQPRRNLAGALEKGTAGERIHSLRPFSEYYSRNKIQLRRRVFSLAAAQLARFISSPWRNKIFMGGSGRPITEAIMESKFEYHGGIKVFGIWLDSRHGRLRELRELIEFAELAQARGVAKYISSVWYDSNGAVAEIECHITPEPCDPVFNVVEAVALRTLTTFFIIGDSDGYSWGRRPSPRQARGNEHGSPVPPAWHGWSR